MGFFTLAKIIILLVCSIQVRSVLAGTLVMMLALSFMPAYAQNDFEIVGSRTYTDSAGNFHIVGEVKNITNRTWRFIEVAVPMLDADDRVIDAPTGFLFVEYLRPGESGAFHILRTNGEQYEAAVAYAIHLDYIMSDLPNGALEVMLDDIAPASTGVTRITGEVENLGNVTATQVQVSAALYDVDGELIDTTVGFTGDIPPGERTPFTLVSGVSGAGEFDRISLNVQSREYARIPEFPVPALGLLAGLAAAIVLARRQGYFSSIFFK
jgi:hypothetical protein